MKTTVEFLDAVKQKHGLTSDYQLSKHLCRTASSIGNYRHGKSLMDEEMACKVATELGLDSGYVLACIASERAKNPEVKAAWKHTADVLYGLAAALALVAILPFIDLPASDNIMTAALSHQFDNNMYYAKIKLSIIALCWASLLVWTCKNDEAPSA